MAQWIRAQVVLPWLSGLPEDVITNTFYIANGADTDLDVIGAASTSSFITFYQEIYGVANFPASYVDWGGGFINYYDLAEPTPRVPFTDPMPLVVGTLSSTTIPSELAVVASFHGAPISGQPNARRRGRVYLGGFGDAVDIGVTNRPPMVSASLITNINDAMLGLEADIRSITGASWNVYSPTIGTFPASFAQVVGGWCDNTFDTQRRRGVPATSRETWAAP